MGLVGAFSEFALRPSSLEVQEKRRGRKIERYIDARRTHSHVRAIRATYVERTQIRSYVRIAAKSHPCPASSLFKLSLSSSLMRQNFPLMSNSRIDFHFVRFLCLSLFFLCLLFTAHTIIVFVPLRSSVVLNFRVPAPRRKKGEEKGEVHLSIPQTWYRCSYEKKDPRKKRACALACLPACN